MSENIINETISNDIRNRLQWSLLSLRLGVFVVMLMWTIDKFVNPGHSIKIFEHFYAISGLGENIAYILGAAQLILVLAFVAGIKNTSLTVLSLYYMVVQPCQHSPSILMRLITSYFLLHGQCGLPVLLCIYCVMQTLK
jgi:hypothetical protein